MPNGSAEEEIMAVADLASNDHPSLEQVRCTDAFPKTTPKRLLANGEMEESTSEVALNKWESSYIKKTNYRL